MRSTIAGLAILVTLSGFATIFVRHKHRMTFHALQVQEQERDRLNNKWRQLLIEESTWSFPAFVEQKARDRLNMVFPQSIGRLVVEGE